MIQLFGDKICCMRDNPFERAMGYWMNESFGPDKGYPFEWGNDDVVLFGYCQNEQSYWSRWAGLSGEKGWDRPTIWRPIRGVGLMSLGERRIRDEGFGEGPPVSWLGKRSVGEGRGPRSVWVRGWHCQGIEGIREMLRTKAIEWMLIKMKGLLSAMIRI